MSAILLEREIVHYEVLGRGRPLIFLHGWVGSWRYWIPVMQAASVSFRAYALDLWGFGDTSKNRAHYAIEQQVQLLERFLEEMGILKTALIGHGLGAVVSMLFAQRHPQVVDRVMAVGYPGENGFVNARLRTSPPQDLVDWLLGRNGSSEAVRADAPKTDAAAVQISLQNLPAVPLGDLWRKMATACLLVSGEKDPAVQSIPVEQLAEMPAQMHAVAFEQSGHFPMLDEGSKFNRLMSDFLALPSGESPRELQLKEEWKRRVR